MPDDPQKIARRMPSNPTITALLSVALSFNLIFSAVLLFGLPEPSQAFIPEAGSQAPPELASQPSPTADLGTLLAQMQSAQTNLQSMALQLEQKSQAQSQSSSLIAESPTTADMELAALWAEIERLNEVMKPLMAQVDAVSASQSSRPASELIALRTQVNTIHQRLTYLLARVKAIQAQKTSAGGMGFSSHSPGSSLPAGSLDPSQQSFEQLYRNMTELKSLLQQMQFQSTSH